MDDLFISLCNQIYEFVIENLEIKQETYTAIELAEILHTSEKNINNLRNVGILNGIKTGKGFVFSNLELRRFLQDYEGYDVSNYEAMLEAKNSKKKKLRKLAS